MSGNACKCSWFNTWTVLGSVMSCLVLTTSAAGQTAPGTAVSGDPFEVHGLLYSGSAPLGYAAGDGWAQGATHLGVLDANGNAAKDASGMRFRASWDADPNWGNQGDGVDSVFASGNKNSDLIGVGDSPWTWDMGGGGPQKNDITNTYFHTRVDPITGDRWVFVAAETRSINGDSHVDFEFNQAGVAQVGTTGGQLVGLGPDGGRTVNDFLITIDFEKGGENPVATVRFWNGSSFELASLPGAVFSATNFVDIPHGSEGTWKHFTDDGAETDVLTRLQLVEGGANLTALGIDVDPCSTDATFMVKTRSSSSWTSDLKDYALVYFPLEPPPQLEVSAPERVCAGSSFEVSAAELTGLANAAYTWEITGCGWATTDTTAETVTVQTDPNCNCEVSITAAVTGGECENADAVTHTVIVRDDVAPQLSDEPADVTVECDAVPAAPEVTATDECSEANLQLDELETPGACLGDSSITRTWTATDECQNTTTHNQVVTVQDTTAPSLTGVPADETASCDAVPQPPVVTAADNCSDATVQLTEDSQPGSCIGDSTLTRTWTGTDDCGNETSESQVISIVDQTAPELSGVPADVTVECDAVPAAALVTATDNCSDAPVQFTETPEPGTCLGQSTITRTWSAADDCGNESSASQIIQLVDTTPPVLIGVPADMTAECDSLPEPPVVTATDNCSEPPVEFSETSEPGPYEGTAVITRTWTATDACGNQTTESQTIVVEDTTAPVLSGVPGDMDAECNAVPAPPEVTASDNCTEPLVELSESSESGSCNGESTITRTWTATDASGNEVTATQTIRVLDTTAPTLQDVPADESVACDAVPEAATVTASDNCSAAQVALDESSEPGACTGASTITRTWTATDDCGNQASQTQTLTVTDTAPPVFSDDPADITVECDSVPRPPDVTASDTCDPDSTLGFAEEMAPGECSGNYSLTRTWTAMDACGNDASVTQSVTVQDTTRPTITLESATTEYICDGVPAAFTVSAADNCGAAALLLDSLRAITATNRVEVIATLLPNGDYTITATGPALIEGGFSATDECGNVSSPFSILASARVGREACSQGFWKNHFDRWGPTGFSPSDRFLDAFEITDLSSPEIPSSFDPDLTLGEAASNTSGNLGQLLVHGTGALLNAAHPDVDFPATVSAVRAVMQAAFAGEITFDEARAFFGVWNSAERECGCSVQ